jgi:D-alanyl-lipoteichoic acid acyltransferase DltB (MBOAT superfamily)
LPLDAAEERGRHIYAREGCAYCHTQQVRYLDEDIRRYGAPTLAWETSKPCRSALDFAVYVAFFPQLVAGPIVRARDFLPQMVAPNALTRERITLGLWEILRGMARKLVVADIVGRHLVDTVYRDAATLESSGGLAVAVATFGFLLQIFGDFAGYSDIAIGSARLLGFDLRKNFDRPLRATSLESFWSRWHISMTSWFYLYVFAGIVGNKSRMPRICLGLFLTLLLSGVWHGAGWTFILWGAWLGAWMVISRLVRNRLPGDRMPDKPIFALLGWMYTFLVVGASLVLFRSRDMSSVAAALRALADWRGPVPATITELPWQVWTVLAVGFAAALWPDAWNDRMLARWSRLSSLAQGAVLAASMLFFLGVSPPGSAPFLYFRF